MFTKFKSQIILMKKNGLNVEHFRYHICNVSLSASLRWVSNPWSAWLNSDPTSPALHIPKPTHLNPLIPTPSPTFTPKLTNLHPPRCGSNHAPWILWAPASPTWVYALTRRLDGCSHYRLSLVRPWDQESEVYLNSICSLTSITHKHVTINYDKSFLACID